jgi:hypothetical protein
VGRHQRDVTAVTVAARAQAQAPGVVHNPVKEHRMTPRSLRRALLASALTTAALAGGATAADAATVNISASPATVTEGGVAKFNYGVGQVLGEGAVTFRIALEGGSAGPEDHGPASVVTVTKPACPGNLGDPGGCGTSGLVEVPITSDLLDENDETLRATLLDVTGANVGTGSADVTILDDDATPTLEVDGGTLIEGNAGTRYIDGDVELSAPSGRDVFVDYATNSGSAASGVDFGQRSGVVLIPAGETEGGFEIPVYGDSEVEPDEDFRVSLSNPVNATIADGDADITIRNDDAVPPPAPLPTDLALLDAPRLPDTPTTSPVNTGAPNGNAAPQGGQAAAAQGIAQTVAAGQTKPAPAQDDEINFGVSLSFKGMTTGPKVKVSCDARERVCRGRLQVKLGDRTFKTRHFRLEGGEKRTITIALSRKVRRKLRRAGQVYIKAITQDAAGNRDQTLRGWNL